MDPKYSDPMDLHLNKLETSCPVDISDKSWLPFYCCFFRKKILSLFSIKAYVLLWTPNGSLDLHLNKLETSCRTAVSDKSWLPCYNWFFRRIFLKLISIKTYVKLWTPNARTPWIPGPSFEQTWNIMSYWCVRQIMTALLLLVLQKKIFKAFFPLKPMLNFGPQILGPHGPLDLHLNKLETSCPTDVSDKSWLPCFCLFFFRRFLKLCSH